MYVWIYEYMNRNKSKYDTKEGLEYLNFITIFTKK